MLSCLRPFPRRIFTCGHELGHHVFNHGMKVDIIAEESEDSTFKSSDEILVDSFSAALLMPVGGIQAEFSERNLSFQ
uniref:ImmA/IrrE family metallo-endopeptidase n=1 Tax=Rhizobium leguminosarum TaxID=384 RepID=UPI003F9576DD